MKIERGEILFSLYSEVYIKDTFFAVNFYFLDFFPSFFLKNYPYHFPIRYLIF